MIVCIDTNTVLQALRAGHPYAPILDAWIHGRLTWAVSTDILLEYEEVITRMSGSARWRMLGRLMDLSQLTTGNLLRITPRFHFHVIVDDPDDNHFTDCAIAANADYVITEDHHFAPLVGAGFKPQPIRPAEFIAKYLSMP